MKSPAQKMKKSTVKKKSVLETKRVRTLTLMVVAWNNATEVS